jgi:hypothetical protein
VNEEVKNGSEQNMLPASMTTREEESEKNPEKAETRTNESEGGGLSHVFLNSKDKSSL